jgi:hypothetical protein
VRGDTVARALLCDTRLVPAAWSLETVEHSSEDNRSPPDIKWSSHYNPSAARVPPIDTLDLRPALGTSGWWYRFSASAQKHQASAHVCVAGCSRTASSLTTRVEGGSGWDRGEQKGKGPWHKIIAHHRGWCRPRRCNGPPQQCEGHVGKPLAGCRSALVPGDIAPQDVGWRGEAFLGVKLVDPTRNRARWEQAQAALAQGQQQAQVSWQRSGLEALGAALEEESKVDVEDRETDKG